MLYPGDDSIEGKILRLKQQYTLCSASLQDIVERFVRRSGANIKWEEFPEKVAVQMNDTHPTLCIPELMRILLDLKGLSWEEAWNVTQRYMLVNMLVMVDLHKANIFQKIADDYLSFHNKGATLVVYLLFHIKQFCLIILLWNPVASKCLISMYLVVYFICFSQIEKLDK